jgi:regulator of sigma E protease
MNLLLPLLLFSVAFMVPHEVVMGEVLVADVAPNSPAARAGIEPGDIVLKANGDQVFNTAWLQRYIQLNLGREVTLLIKHADSTLEEVHLVPRWRPPEGQGAIGVVIKMANPSLVTQYYPFWRAIPMGIRQCVETFILFKNGIISVIIGTASVVIAGPIGIVQVTGEVAQAGVRPLLELAAFISIALGIFNLFPLPAIDGGRIAFVLLEVVRRGKRVSPRTEGLVHTIGFILLVGVLLIITYQDILRIISGERLIP